MKLKVLAVAVLIISLFFTLSVSAVCDVKITLDDEFFTLSDDAEKVCEITGQTKEQLDEYCSAEGIVFLAVNSENTKQVKATSKKTAFSEKLQNLSMLNDADINEIAKALVKGENLDFSIEEKNSQMFIRTEQMLSDSGGEYSQVNYITVADECIYTLSFSTSSGEDTDYIKSAFASFDCGAFLNVNASQNVTGVVSTVVISLIGLFVLYTLVRDLMNDRKQKSEPLIALENNEE